MSARQLGAAALVALCGAVDGAAAEDLFLLRSGPDEVVLLDRDSLVRQGGRARAWVVERKESRGGRTSEVRRLYVFDCAARTLGSGERSGGEPVTAPPLTGLEQTLLAYACGR